MKNYLAYKNQIRGFQDVAETVKVEEKIAASAIHLLRGRVADLNDFSDEVRRALEHLSHFYKAEDHLLLQKRKGRKAAVIVTGGKGLVGGLWHLLINRFLMAADAYQLVITVGAKGAQYLEEEGITPEKSFSAGKEDPAAEDRKEIADYLFSEFKLGRFTSLEVIYPRFHSLAQQTAETLPFLPFDFSYGGSEEGSVSGLPLFEPSAGRLFDFFLEKYIRVFFHKILLETRLSELSARTVAAEHASKKTEDLIGDLRMEYFKGRRRILTRKQLESFAVHKTL